MSCGRRRPTCEVMGAGALIDSIGGQEVRRIKWLPRVRTRLLGHKAPLTSRGARPDSFRKRKFEIFNLALPLPRPPRQVRASQSALLAPSGAIARQRKRLTRGKFRPLSSGPRGNRGV